MTRLFMVYFQSFRRCASCVLIS